MEEKENKPRNISIEERIREANIAAEQEEVEKMIQDLNYKRINTFPSERLLQPSSKRRSERQTF